MLTVCLTGLGYLPGIGLAARATPIALHFAQALLTIREEALGESHADVFLSLSLLSWLHTALGDYAAALPLAERALSILEAIMGVDSPIVALSLDNLAAI